MNGNGETRRGRPPLRFGEPSEVVTVRFPQSDYDRLDKLAREIHVSIPELIRQIPMVIRQLQLQLEKLEADLDQTMRHFMNLTTNDERSLTFVRLLMARAQRPSCESAIQLFLDECPSEIHAPIIRRILEKFRTANLQRPGSVTDEQLWKSVGM